MPRRTKNRQAQRAQRGVEGEFALDWRGDRDVVLVAGGGTGGHLFPGLVLGRTIAERTGAFVVAVGRDSEEERARANQYGLAHIGLNVSGLRRRLGWDTVRTAVRLVGAVGAARRILRRLRPSLVLGMGGYASAPTLVAAQQFGVPIVLHEQNVVPGRVTRWFSPRAQVTCLTFPQAGAMLRGRTVTSGFPIRPETLAKPRAEAAAVLGLRPDRLTVVVTGGSQGARALCNATVEMAAHFAPHERPIQVLLIAGKRNIDEVLSRPLPDWLVVRDFVDDMGAVYGLADLVVARAGAATIAELATNGIPSVLVPLAIAADDHQRANARVIADRGGCRLLEEHELNGHSLSRTVTELIGSPERLQRMAEWAKDDLHREAAGRVLDAARRWLRVDPERTGSKKARQCA